MNDSTSGSHTYWRITLDIIVAAAVIQGWWFVALPAALIEAWNFPYYGIELVVAGFAYDSLFNTISGFTLQGYVGTIAAVVVLIVLFLLKKVVR